MGWAFGEGGKQGKVHHEESAMDVIGTTGMVVVAAP